MSNNIYDYVIVGAGLSGLYCAYKLIQKGKTNIIILEKNNYLGGRIQSFELPTITKIKPENLKTLGKKLVVNNSYIELGAGVINGNHTKVLNLLKELNLTDDLLILNSPKSFIFNNKKYDNNMAILNNIFNDIINELKLKLLDKEFYENASNISLYKLIKLHHGKKIAKIVMYKFGYHADFLYQNSIDGLKMFDKDYGNGQFYKLQNGLSQIINKLSRFVKNHNVNIIYDINVSNIIKYNDMYKCIINNNNYICKNIIMAVPKANLKKIPYFNNIHYLLNSVKQNSHIRIYATYPKINGHVWFENMPSYTTNDIINNIIPVDVENGMIQYYSDNKNAKLWNKFNKMEILDDALHSIITHLFGKDIPKHNNLIISYKKIGTHMWKPKFNSEELYKQIVKPYNDENIFIIGEAYSNNQQWMVGAINSVDNFLSIHL